VAHRAGAGLLQVAELGLGQLRLGDLVEGELDRGVPVALGLADGGDLGTTVPSSRKTCVMPNFFPRIAAI
jgi:hypothetical protein